MYSVTSSDILKAPRGRTIFSLPSYSQPLTDEATVPRVPGPQCDEILTCPGSRVSHSSVFSPQVLGHLMPIPSSPHLNLKTEEMTCPGLKGSIQFTSTLLSTHSTQGILLLCLKSAMAFSSGELDSTGFQIESSPQPTGSWRLRLES